MTVPVQKSFFDTRYPIDKIINNFYGSTTTGSLTTATGAGPFYTPTISTVTVPNPTGVKSFLRLIYTVDGTNYYPPNSYGTNPGPYPYSTIGAFVSGAVDATSVYFYLTNYYPSTTNFTIFWTLDSIL